MLEEELHECSEILDEIEREEVDHVMDDLEISREDAEGVIKVRKILVDAAERNRQLYLCA